MNCGASCARCLLIVFNIVFWLSGAAILGVAIWFLVDDGIEDRLELLDSDEEYMKTAAYILIGFGAFIFIVGFAGCCGAIRKSKCLLGLYIFFLILVFGGELAAGIFAAINKDEITDELDTQLMKSIKEDYKDNSKSWDNIQEELKCCGGTGPDDYMNSTWVIAQNSSDILIPSSCCTRTEAKGDVEDLPKCQKKTPDFFYDKGCKDGLEDWANDHSIILIGVGCGIAALQIFGLVFAICLCRGLDEEKD